MEEFSVTLENLHQFSDDMLKQLFEQMKLDVQKLFGLLAKKFMMASVMQMDSASLEQKATRLLTASNMDMTQQEDLLRQAVFFWSDLQTRPLENKLWNFCINTALKKHPHRKQAILDNTLVKLAALYMKDRNAFMFNAAYTAMEKLIAEGAEISHAVVQHVSAIRANDDDFSLRQLIFNYVSQFAKRFFLLSLCATREESPMSMLPAEIIFMIARNSIGYAETVSTAIREENRRLEEEVRSGYPRYWSTRRAAVADSVTDIRTPLPIHTDAFNAEMRQRADAVAAMVARDRGGRRTNAEEAGDAWLRAQFRQK